MADTPLEPDSPFWRFSLAVYGAAGVSKVCLAVQDRLGGDVNLLLYCAWLGIARGIQLNEAALVKLEQSIADWNEAAVHPLRSARWAIKALPAHQNAVLADFCKEVAALELRAEQIAQAMLYAQPDAIAGVSGSSEIAAANLALYVCRLERAVGKPDGAISVTALIEAAAVHKN